MNSLNIKNEKRCAFCKFWYDPTDSTIKPKDAMHNRWLYDGNARKTCLKRNSETKGSGFCTKYDCKLDIM